MHNRKIERKAFLPTNRRSSFAYFEAMLKTKPLFVWMWRALMVFLILCTVYSVIGLFRDARNKQKYYISSTNKDFSEGTLDDPLFLKFPEITICPRPAWKSGENKTVEAFFRYLYLALGYPFVSITSEESYQVFSEYLSEETVDEDEWLPFRHSIQSSEDTLYRLMSETKNFSLSELIFNNSISCEEMFIECSVSSLPMNCCSLFYPVLTSSGPCFAMDLRTPDLQILELIPKSEPLEFIFDMHSPRTSKSRIEEGFFVFLSHPLEELHFQNPQEAIRVQPSSTTVIRSGLTLVNRIAKFLTWTTLSHNCPILPTYIEPDDNLRGRYRTFSCYMNFMAFNIRNVCDCDVIFAKLTEIDAPRNICSPREMVECFPKAALMSLEDYVVNICDSPCLQYNFEATAFYASFGMPNETRLVLTFNRDEYVLREYQRNTMMNALSQIGGAMGLYLGASIITIIQGLISFFLWIWHRFKLKRKVQVVDMSSLTMYP